MEYHKRLINSRNQYGWLFIAIHWLSALAVIGLYPLGLYIMDLSYYDPEYKTMPALHKSVGMILLLLMLVRVVWRFFNHTPKELPQIGLLQLITKAVHGLLYLLLFIVLFSGYLISTADGREIIIFELINIPALPFAFENQEDVAGEVHWYAATTLIVLSALHLLAALKHHFINRDNTLNRMLGRSE